MAGTRRLLTPVLAAISVFMLVVSIACGHGGADGQTMSSAASVPPPISAANSGSASPDSSASPPVEQSSAPEPIQVSEPPNGDRRFVLSLTGRQVAISANVAPYQAKQRPDGTYEPVDPPRWNTAAWVEQASFPTAPGTGTVYVYGHACHHHTCPFTAIQHTTDGYTVHVGDQIIATTSTGVLTYQVCAIGSSPKSGSLRVPNCGSGVAKDLVLVTCEYEFGDTSLNNIVVVATLVVAARR